MGVLQKFTEKSVGGTLNNGRRVKGTLKLSKYRRRVGRKPMPNLQKEKSRRKP